MDQNFPCKISRAKKTFKCNCTKYKKQLQTTFCNLLPTNSHVEEGVEVSEFDSALQESGLWKVTGKDSPVRAVVDGALSTLQAAGMADPMASSTKSPGTTSVAATCWWVAGISWEHPHASQFELQPNNDCHELTTLSATFFQQYHEW
jgi:hypothetical protein